MAAVADAVGGRQGVFHDVRPKTRGAVWQVGRLHDHPFGLHPGAAFGVAFDGFARGDGVEFLLVGNRGIAGRAAGRGGGRGGGGGGGLRRSGLLHRRGGILRLRDGQRDHLVDLLAGRLGAGRGRGRGRRGSSDRDGVRLGRGAAAHAQALEQVGTAGLLRLGDHYWRGPHACRRGVR